MDERTLLAAALAAAMMTMTVSLFAADQAPAPKSEPIYGYRMMNDAERNDFREKMRNAPSADERQSLRDEHRKQMEARAKERGVTLPEPRGPRAGQPGPGGGRGPGYGDGTRANCPQGQECPGPQAGKGPGYGRGPGAGMGPGSGKGPGYGPRGDCAAGQNCAGTGSGKGPGANQ